MNKKRYERKNNIKMESYEENRVKWLIYKPGGLFLTRRSGTLRRARGRQVEGEQLQKLGMEKNTPRSA